MRAVITRDVNRLTPTSEQQMILDAFSTGEDLAIEAAAGSGKTASLLLCAEGTGKRGVYLAFNRALKEEAQLKFPDTVKVATTHGFAFGVVGKRYAHRLNAARQPWAACADMLRIRMGERFRGGELVIKPGGLARLAADMVNRFCYSKDAEITVAHMPYEDVFRPDELAWLAELLLPYARTYWDDVQQLDGKLRFGHDHYLKMWQLSAPVIRADYLLVDEMQDTNPCVYDVVDHQTHLQRVVVGDPHQALYGWRGAVDALSDFQVPTRLPLTMSFRFGDAVADVANVFLKLLGARHPVLGNPDRDSLVVQDMHRPRAVLTRTNGGAVEALLTALEDDLEVALVGGATDVLAFLEAAEALQDGRSSWHPELSLFKSWDAVLDHMEADPNSEFSMLVRLIHKYSTASLVKALRTTVPEQQADVVISTTHKAKGREFRTVQLGRDLQVRVLRDLYGVRPKLADDHASEQRLRYVAVTRAQDAVDLGPAEPTPRFEKVWAEAGLK